MLQNERERKELAGIRDIASDAAKRVSLHNSKLRDCRIHFNDKAPRRGEDDRRGDTTLFITEGDSASGSITKVRDPNTQAVFSLKGKPLNTHGKTRRVMYENDELSMLHSALNVEAGIEELRYNKLVLATDADVDGMHIRLLLITFFLTFLPGADQERAPLHPANAALPRAQQKRDALLLLRPGAAECHRGARPAAGSHAVQGSRRDFAR